MCLIPTFPTVSSSSKLNDSFVTWSYQGSE